MSSSESKITGGNRVNYISKTDSNIDTLPSPHGQRHTEIRIPPTLHQCGTSGKSHKIDWEPTSGSPVSPPTCKSLPSTGTYKLELLKTEEIRSITEHLSRTKLISDHSNAKPHCSKFVSVKNPNPAFLKQASMTKTKTDTCSSIVRPSRSKDTNQNPLTTTKINLCSSIDGPSRSKDTNQNPLTTTKINQCSSSAGSSGPTYLAQNRLNKTKTIKDSSITTPQRSNTSYQNTFELPLTKRKIAEMFSLAEACKFFLTFMKSKRSDLKCMETQLDCCITEIQKAVRDAEQVCFKLGAESETVAEEMSAAITQSQKLEYLLSISSRSFSKLDQLGTTLETSLQEYAKDTENFHVSVDRLLDYIVQTIFEKCKQSRRK